MKATDLRESNVVSIRNGAGLPEQLVVIVYIDQTKVAWGESTRGAAIGIDIDDDSIVEISKDSDFLSGNGSSIGSWHKLSDTTIRITAGDTK